MDDEVTSLFKALRDSPTFRPRLEQLILDRIDWEARSRLITRRINLGISIFVAVVGAIAAAGLLISLIR